MSEPRKKLPVEGFRVFSEYQVFERKSNIFIYILLQKSRLKSAKMYIAHSVMKYGTDLNLKSIKKTSPPPPPNPFKD